MLNTVTIPEGKLPWPHQKPGFSVPEYQSLLANLRFRSNFGSFRETDDGEALYMNNGLEIVLAEGTKLYSIISGYVKSSPDLHCLSIGDTSGSSPGYGWEYRNTSNFRFQEGDHVRKGDYVCDVYEGGILHLGRVRVKEGGWEIRENREAFLPEKHFYYPDSLPPEIVSPFLFFPNGSDDIFKEGSPIELSGDVDIVVAMRDFTELHSFGFSPHSLGVAKIEYEISGDKISTDLRESFDFNEIILMSVSDPAYDPRVWSIYKDPFSSVIKKHGYGPDFFYYVITNMNGRKECNKNYDAYQGLAWNTSALDRNGEPLFPDGFYVITVRAYDANGNFSEASDCVQVRNRKKTKIRR